MNTDQYVSTRNNRHTGQAERRWIEYADGVFEPVRKNGNLNRKHHGDRRALDWWTVDKPLDWTPADEGKRVSLNHDYGQKAKFKAASEAAPDKAAGGDQAGKAAPPKPGTPGKSTISQGAAGLWEHEARERAEAGKEARTGEAGKIEGTTLRPSLLQPDGHPGKEWAREVLKNELMEFARGFLDTPDPVVTPIQEWGRVRENNKK